MEGREYNIESRREKTFMNPRVQRSNNKLLSLSLILSMILYCVYIASLLLVTYIVIA